jgi:hypothetical protein
VTPTRCDRCEIISAVEHALGPVGQRYVCFGWKADIRDNLCNTEPMGQGNAQLRGAVVVVAAWIVASGAAAAALALLTSDIRFFTPIFVVVAAVSGLLGLPVYLAARAKRNDTPIVAAIMGFIVGSAIPAILIFSGPAADEASSGGTATVVNGSYTAAGWLQNFALIGFLGLVGVGGALAFWKLVGRRPIAETEEDAPSRKRPARTALLSVGALGVLAIVFVIPSVTADRSCHNPLRGGGNSIAQAASFDLRVGLDQWRNVERELETFRRAGNWSIRSDVRTDQGFPWFQISLCKEPGTNIFVQGMPDEKEVNFGIYQPQGGSGWQADFRLLHDRISARWPDKISYRDGHGSPISAPAWAKKAQDQ